MVLITFVGATAAITYRNEIMNWAHADATPYYGEIMIYLMLSFISLSIAYIFGSLIVASNKLKKLNILLIGGVAVNFLLNMYLIPHDHALRSCKSNIYNTNI